MPSHQSVYSIGIRDRCHGSRIVQHLRERPVDQPQRDDPQQRHAPMHKNRLDAVVLAVEVAVLELEPHFLDFVEAITRLGGHSQCRHHDDPRSEVLNWAMEARRSPARVFSSVAAAAACLDPTAYCRDTSAT